MTTTLDNAYGPVPATEPLALKSNLVLGPNAPKPRAWAIFVDSGNARIWSTLQPHVQKLADAEGLQVTPLYDQAAIDAAVAAERERWQAAAAAALGWMEGAWHRIDGEWGPSGKTLDQECADGDEPEIAALRTLLRA